MCSKRTRLLCNLYKHDKNSTCRACLEVTLCIMITAIIIGAIPFYGILVYKTTGFNPTSSFGRCSESFYVCGILGFLLTVVTVLVLGALFLIFFALYELFDLCRKIYREFKEKSKEAALLEVKIQS